MDTTLNHQIDDALDGRRLLTHPFYVRWQAGELGHDELRSYAEQYGFFERRLPQFLTELSQRLDPGPIRDAVVANLDDEVGPPSHVELFALFADAVGARDAAISPAMAALLEAYRTALDEGADVAMAGLVAYERQGAAIANTKRGGLLDHYGVRGDGLEFWSAHGTVEDDHARWTLEALEELEPTTEAVQRGVGLVADAWWDFLNERESLSS
jgi:pyrroloquinoline quinone (PQQ) biosynthesis protein C